MKSKIDSAFEEAAKFGCTCLVCGQTLMRAGNALKCENGHTVNANRKGYFNFLTRPVSAVYDAELFEARNRILEAGFYNDLIEEICGRKTPGMTVLDAGTGSGYYLKALARKMEGAYAGIDLSREAIEQAAEPGALWMVADLRRLPFPDGCFDVILSILSPADYRVFSRLLKPSGMLIKVTPGPDYLKEIREARGLPEGTESASDAYLPKKMHLISSKQLKQVHPVTPGQWRDFIYMTPLNLGLSKEEKDRLADKPKDSITIDLNVQIANFALKDAK